MIDRERAGHDWRLRAVIDMAFGTVVQALRNTPNPANDQALRQA